MLDLAAKLFEDRPGARRGGRLARPSGRAACLAAPARSSRRPGIRRKRRPCAAHLRRQRSLDARRHGAHLDEQLAFDVAGEQARRPVIDRVDRRAVGQDGDDCFAGGGERARGSPRPWRRRRRAAWFSPPCDSRRSPGDPTSSRRAAMALPMAPRPATPICIRHLLALRPGADDRRSARGEKAACARSEPDAIASRSQCKRSGRRHGLGKERRRRHHRPRHHGRRVRAKSASAPAGA